MTQDVGTSEAPRSPVSLRVVLLALLCSPFLGLWIFNAEIVHGGIHATVLSVFFTSICGLAAAVAANALLRRLAPRLALRPGELVVFYALLNLITSMGSHDLVQILPPLITYPYRFATPENGWDELFVSQLPRRLTIPDERVLTGFFEGHASFWAPDVLGTWAGPLLAWTLFIGLVLTATLALCLLVRRAWCDDERLSFPCIHLPLQMTTPGGPWRSGWLWAGFAAAGLLNLLRGLHALYPAVPTVTTVWDAQTFVTTQPWRAIGWTPVALYPFAVGLAYFMPQDLAFSTWFFYLFWKAQMVVRAWLGFDPLAGPYASDQSAGAWIALGLFALFATRGQLADGLRQALRGERDPREPVSRRTALLLLLGALAGLAWFLRGMGLSWPVIAGFWAVHLTICVAVTRMRAELGPPTHDLFFAGGDWLLTAAAGPGSLGPANLRGLTLLYWITRDYRSLAMPHQLEALKMLELRGSVRREGARLAAAMMLVAVVGFLVCAAMALHQYYDQGASAGIRGYALGQAQEAYTRLDQWLTAADPGPDHAGLRQFAGGAVLTLGLMLLRRRFLGLPFHPVGYAIAGSWTMSWLWFSVLLSWLAKGLILRHGGLNRFRAAMPFFLGLMLGDYLVGGGQTIAGMLLGVRVPGFFT